MQKAETLAEREYLEEVLGVVSTKTP